MLYLACKSVRSACTKKDVQIGAAVKSDLKMTYLKGIALQLSNPKVILSFASIYAILLPANTSPQELVAVIVAISFMANIVFQTYAIYFQTPPYVPLTFVFGVILSLYSQFFLGLRELRY